MKCGSVRAVRFCVSVQRFAVFAVHRGGRFLAFRFRFAVRFAAFLFFRRSDHLWSTSFFAGCGALCSVRWFVSDALHIWTRMASSSSGFMLMTGLHSAKWSQLVSVHPRSVSQVCSGSSTAEYFRRSSAPAFCPLAAPSVSNRNCLNYCLASSVLAPSLP